MVNYYGHTALIIAGERGNSEAVKILIEKCAFINTADNKDKTALIWAESKSYWEIVNILKAAIIIQGAE